MLIKDVVIEWNMEWLAERIKMGGRVNLFMYSFNLIVVLV